MEQTNRNVTNIGIDYDGTISEDPSMWKRIIKIMQDSGHNVYCITKRYKQLSKDIKDTLPKDMKIIFVETKFKTETTNKMKLKIDVWIDDKPHLIYPIINRFSRSFR